MLAKQPNIDPQEYLPSSKIVAAEFKQVAAGNRPLSDRADLPDQVRRAVNRYTPTAFMGAEYIPRLVTDGKLSPVHTYREAYEVMKVIEKHGADSTVRRLYENPDNRVVCPFDPHDEKLSKLLPYMSTRNKARKNEKFYRLLTVGAQQMKLYDLGFRKEVELAFKNAITPEYVLEDSLEEYERIARLYVAEEDCKGRINRVREAVNRWTDFTVERSSLPPDLNVESPKMLKALWYRTIVPEGVNSKDKQEQLTGINANNLGNVRRAAHMIANSRYDFVKAPSA